MRGVCFCVVIMLSCICRSQISTDMENFIKHYEGLSTEVYMDGPHLAVGYGHHIRFTEMEWVRDLEPGMEITEELAELLFRYDMLYLVNPGLIEVKKDLGWDYPSNVYDVMGSIIYHIGYNGLKESDFYRCFKSRQYEEAFTQLLLLKSKDKGIRKRREAELKILLLNYDPAAHLYKNIPK